MSNYIARSDQIVASACKDAARKLVAKHDRVSELWSEARSIPAGCGCTPFYADARDAEEQFRKEVVKFEKVVRSKRT